MPSWPAISANVSSPQILSASTSRCSGASRPRADSIAIRRSSPSGSGSNRGLGPESSAMALFSRASRRTRRRARSSPARQPALAPPEPDEGLLHDVLGIGHRDSPLPRAKEQLRAVTAKPVFPGLILREILHRNRVGRGRSSMRRRRVSILSKSDRVAWGGYPHPALTPPDVRFTYRGGSLRG